MSEASEQIKAYLCIAPSAARDGDISLEPTLSVLDFVSQLWRKTDFSPKLRNKIRNGKRGFEAMAICYWYESAYFPAPYIDNQLLCSLCPKWSHTFNSAGFKHNHQV